MKRLLGLLLALALGCFAVTTASIVAYSKVDETRPADVAIVLGAGLGVDGPSPVFRARIDHAVALYLQGQVSAVVLTGGMGEGSVRSDAAVARDYALAQGLPAEAVAIEESSTITQENLVNAKAIMDEHGWRTALVVSDPLHMKRAMLLARDAGIEAYSSPTPTSAYRSWSTKLPFLMREEFFYLGYRIARLLP